MKRWAKVVYPTKEGASPLLGGLWLAGFLREGDRVLDVGCGTGTDTLALARWGARRAVGLDVSARAIAVARRRARAQRSRARFEVGDVLDVPRTIGRGAFDAVVDTMCCNNLMPGEEQAYVDALAWAARRGGRVVVQGRVTKRDFAREAGLPWLEPFLEERFDLAGPVHVPLPEERGRAAPVAALVGWKRGR